MDKIAVLIPCYNESKTIEKVVTDFKKVLPEAVIYVYDNNSTDHTDEIARKMCIRDSLPPCMIRKIGMQRIILYKRLTTVRILFCRQEISEES